nr:translation initiation factor IF-2-like [Aegilops tauschii subsp. strangulata]
MPPHPRRLPLRWPASAPAAAASRSSGSPPPPGPHPQLPRRLVGWPAPAACRPGRLYRAPRASASGQAPLGVGSRSARLAPHLSARVRRLRLARPPAPAGRLRLPTPRPGISAFARAWPPPAAPAGLRSARPRLRAGLLPSGGRLPVPRRSGRVLRARSRLRLARPPAPAGRLRLPTPRPGISAFARAWPPPAAPAGLRSARPRLRAGLLPSGGRLPVPRRSGRVLRARSRLRLARPPAPAGRLRLPTPRPGISAFARAWPPPAAPAGLRSARPRLRVGILPSGGRLSVPRRSGRVLRARSRLRLPTPRWPASLALRPPRRWPASLPHGPVPPVPRGSAPPGLLLHLAPQRQLPAAAPPLAGFSSRAPPAPPAGMPPRADCSASHRAQAGCIPRVPLAGWREGKDRKKKKCEAGWKNKSQAG